MSGVPIMLIAWNVEFLLTKLVDILSIMAEPILPFRKEIETESKLILLELE